MAFTPLHLITYVLIIVTFTYEGLASSNRDDSGEWAFYRNSSVPGCYPEDDPEGYAVHIPLQTQAAKFRMFVLQTEGLTLHEAKKRAEHLTNAYQYKLVALINGGYFDQAMTPLSFYKGYKLEKDGFVRVHHWADNGVGQRSCLVYEPANPKKTWMQILDQNVRGSLIKADVQVSCAGPMLVQNHQNVYERFLWEGGFHPDTNTSGIDALAKAQPVPRAAACLTTKGNLMLFSFQGRKYRCGPTLDQLTQRLQDVGCLDAINLDGGSSVAMYAVEPNTWKPFFSVGHANALVPVWIAIGWRPSP